ncbi:kinase-like domain-containing protein [Rhizoctonia solani]|nr:kinase-like domain-containing protein [Rhizoctonia solani]
MEHTHQTRKASHDSGTAVIGNTTVSTIYVSLRWDKKSTLKWFGDTQPIENVVSLLVQRGCKDLTGDIPTENAPIRPHAYGGACDVYKWILNWNGPAAIKNLRCSSSSDAEAKLPKRAAKELLTWLQLDHPNVLPLLGLAVFSGGLSMVSPWMPYGNLRAYLQRNKGEGIRMGFCEQIRTGLVYIHSKDMVHGDMKAMNVTVSHEGTAMITDFGNSLLKDLALSFAPTTTFGMTHQYAPPEHLAAEYMPVATKQSDVYSYGMEILTGEIPFAGKNVTWLVMQASLGKLLPTRPGSIGDDIWSILLPCWAHDPSKRPSISTIYFPKVGSGT